MTLTVILIFFFVDKHNMIAAFQWLCNFFLKKKRGKKKYFKKKKNKDLQCVVTLFFLRIW